MFADMSKRVGLRTELTALVRLGAPLALAQVGLNLMGFVDVAVVGRLGAVPLAGVGVANAVFFGVIVLGMGTMMGFDPLVSQAVGANDLPRARRLLWQAVWLSVLVSAVLAVPIVLLPETLVPFGISEEIAREARAYIHVRMLALPPFFLYGALRSYLQALRRPGALVVAVVVANVANLALDVGLVFGVGPIPALGVVGAAISTVVCTVLQIAILIAAVARVKVEGFARAGRAMDLQVIRRAFRVGLPVGLQYAAEVGVFALAALLAARMGAAAASAHQIAISLASLSFCAAMGVASAGSVRVGHAIGAKDPEGTRTAGLLAFAVGGGFMATSALAFLIWPRQLAALLTNQPEVLAAAAPLMLVAAAFQVSDGLQAVGGGVLRGAGDTRAAFLANLVGHYAVGLPIALWVGLYLGKGVVGLWWGLAAGLTAVAAFLLWRFVRLSSRPIGALEEPAPQGQA